MAKQTELFPEVLSLAADTAELLAQVNKPKSKPKKIAAVEQPLVIQMSEAEREHLAQRIHLEDHTTLMQVSQAETYALDTETEKWKDRNDYFKVKLLGVSVSANGRQALYRTDPEKWVALMPKDGQKIVMHNSKFDLLTLKRHGLIGDLTPEQFEDTKIAAHLIDENRYQYSLKALAQDWLGVENPMLYVEAEQKGKLLDPEVFNEYARNDARYTARLWENLKPDLVSQGLMRVYNLEKGLVPILNEMESAGIRIDASKIDTLRATAQKEIRKAEEAVYDLAGRKFNIGSGDQLAEVLFDELGLKSNFQTKSGKRSTDKEALAALEGEHKIIPHVQAYRMYGKLDSAFLKALPKFLDENNRIHPSFNSQGAKTGRFSCSEPNVQQIPSKSEIGQQIRSAFIPSDGYSFVVADYSAMELRVLASYVAKTTKDFSLAKLVEEKDPHSKTAAEMFSKAVEECGKDSMERSVAKWINFGIVYGITAKGLGARLRAIGLDVSDLQAELYIRTYLDTYPGVDKFMRAVETSCQDKGFVKDAFGRRRRLTGWSRREARQAVNYVIQGTSADIVKNSMVILHRELKNYYPDARILFQVHDELGVEVPDELAKGCRKLVIEVMSDAAPGMIVPMKVDAHIGKNWKDAK